MPDWDQLRNPGLSPDPTADPPDPAPRPTRTAHATPAARPPWRPCPGPPGARDSPAPLSWAAPGPAQTRAHWASWSRDDQWSNSWTSSRTLARAMPPDRITDRCTTCFGQTSRPSTHRHPLRKVSSGLALRGSVAGHDPAAARPNESVMLGPTAMNTAKPASASSRWSQALPVEGVTPADLAVLSMGERTRPRTPRQATAPCSVTMDDQTCDHGKSQSSAARPASVPFSRRQPRARRQ